MLMPAPTLAARPTRNVAQLLCVANAAQNNGASVETEPSIKPARPGCTTCNRNNLFACDFSSSLNLVCAICSAVCAWLRSSSARSPSSCRMPVSVVRRAGGLVKPARLDFHRLGGFLDGLQAERADEPDGLAVDEAAHVLPADVRDVVAEARLVKFQQTMAVAILLAAHLAEFGGLFGIIFLQAVGKILVDARVLFLQRDGEREDFLFGEAVECFHKSKVEPRCSATAVSNFGGAAAPPYRILFHKYGENKRAMASRNFTGTVRAVHFGQGHFVRAGSFFSR